MTFDEVDKIICSYGFYCYDKEENNKSKYYKYPGICIIVLYTENLCEQNYNSLDKKHIKEKDLNRVDVVTFSPIVLLSTGEIGVNYAIESLRLWRKNIHTKSLKLTEERLHKELKILNQVLNHCYKNKRFLKLNKNLKN